jgi:single-stranded-DNA-specific exonuclease
VDDGYGLNREALLRLGELDCALVVTVDNGTTRADAIAEAQERGQRVVVTDHHEPTETLPSCPVINPKRADSSYPFDGLAGCGVALKLVLGVARRMGRLNSPEFKALLPDLMALVAVGTIADVVPLVDENRSLVALGLRALAATRHPGMRALLEVSRCRDSRVQPSDVAFRIGPRINAAGRLRSAHLALDLLLCDDAAESTRLARSLDEGNRERQQVERGQAEEAYAMAEASLAEADAPALVLADPGWHAGVIGIVAARVAETYHKPAALITIEGEEARGSARSFGGVRLHEALDACRDQLLTHGGHAYAAGFTLRADRIDAFREAFQEAVARQDGAAPGPREVDAELPLEALSVPLAREIEMLQPFGHGNDEPLFCARGLKLAGRPRRMGQGERHLAFHAATERTSVRAVAFGQADKESLLGDRFDLAFVLRTANGPDPYEIHVREIAPS